MTLQDTKLKLVKLHSQLLGTNGHECHSVSDCNLNFADALLEEVAKVVCAKCRDLEKYPLTTNVNWEFWHTSNGDWWGKCKASAIRSGKGKELCQN